MSMTWHGDQILARATTGAQSGLTAAARQLLTASQARAPVASGELRASGSIAVSGTTATITYTAPHALPVHEGTTHHPARAFLRDAIGDGTGLLQTIGAAIKF